MKGLIQGLVLFALRGEKDDVCAEHDIIYAGQNSGPDQGTISAQHAKHLEGWGWHYDEDVGSWAYFV